MRQYRIYVHYLHKQFEQPVVKEEGSNEDDKVSKQLYASPDGGVVKNYKLHQQKSNWEINAECHEQRGDMRLKCIKAKIEDLFLEDILIRNRINEQTQKRIAAAASSIPKGLQWNIFPEGWVKKINKLDDPVFRHIPKMPRR